MIFGFGSNINTALVFTELEALEFRKLLVSDCYAQEEPM